MKNLKSMCCVSLIAFYSVLYLVSARQKVDSDFARLSAQIQLVENAANSTTSHQSAESVVGTPMVSICGIPVKLNPTLHIHKLYCYSIFTNQFLLELACEKGKKRLTLWLRQQF